MRSSVSQWPSHAAPLSPKILISVFPCSSLVGVKCGSCCFGNAGSLIVGRAGANEDDIPMWCFDGARNQHGRWHSTGSYSQAAPGQLGGDPPHPVLRWCGRGILIHKFFICENLDTKNTSLCPAILLIRIVIFKGDPHQKRQRESTVNWFTEGWG